MMYERFDLSDREGNLIIAKNNLGRMMLWLSENEYFLKRPDDILVLTEENTNKDFFSVPITKNTTLNELRELWEPLSRGL